MRSSVGLFILLVAATAVSPAQAPITEAHGTVNELMIGIIDPNTNTVGYAAFLDPEAPSDEPTTDAYAGWPRVQSAAIAMAEAANLLVIPGRMCSNGQPAPVDEEDWIEWTGDLRAAGLAGYQAARNKSQDTLLDLSEQMTASCIACHTRYLDVGGDPTNRCMP
jgi:hypothetical protein